MRKILIDSSAWVSYFLKNKNDTQIINKIDQIITSRNCSILLPELIYCEVKNVLNRLKVSPKIAKTCKSIFKGKIIKIYIGNKSFWFKKVDLYSQKVILHTQDLIILTHALEQKVETLITGDKKLYEAFLKLKNYE